MNNRTLGQIEISPLGLGCWAIGGPFTLGGVPDGWGEVDDRESIRAIRSALDQGVRFFDTSDAYGAGHSETVLGQALKGRRDQAVIATKFGYTYNEATKEVFERYDVSSGYIRQACERSLKRLGTDYIDLYQIHVGSLPQAMLEEAIEALERLQGDGLIRAYGWSTWDAAQAGIFARKSRGAAVQFPMNVFRDAPAMIDVCENNGLAAIVNSPLAMGLLSGKFDGRSKLPPEDVRGSGHEWVAYFKDGRAVSEYLDRLEAVREILTSNGRTLVQGALAWIWARSGAAIPIPGFKTCKQADELVGAIAYGPLTSEHMSEIQRLAVSEE